MVFPLPNLGQHTAIFGGTGTGKSALLKGVAVEAARKHKVFYASLEDDLRPDDEVGLVRAGVQVLHWTSFEALDTLGDTFADTVLVIDGLHFLPVTKVGPFKLADSARRVAKICDRATKLNASLIASFQTNRASLNDNSLEPRTTKPWDLFTTQWKLANRPDVDAPAGHLRATCVLGEAVGTVFNFRPWR